MSTVPKKILVDIDLLEHFLKAYEGDTNVFIGEDVRTDLRECIARARSAK